VLPVLIVGAGPTGLTLGCELLRRGIECLVIDRAKKLFTGSRGKGLQPRTLEVFDDLGIIDAVLAGGAPFPPFRLYRGRDLVWERSLEEMMRLPAAAPSSAVPYPRPWLIPQWRTDQILFDHFISLGGRVAMATEALGLQQDEDRVRVAVSRDGSPDTIVARWVVGTDGGRSSIRRSAGFTFEGETDASEHTFIGDVRVKGLTGDACHILTKDGDMGQRVAFWNLPGSEHYQFVATMPANDVPELTLASVVDLLRRRTDRIDLELDALSWCSLYRTSVRMVDRLRIGRVLVAGDAAHVHSPAGGQGLNTAVQDAYNLGWKLARAVSHEDEEILDTYEEERLPVAASLLGFTSRLRKIGFGTAAASGTPSVSPSLYQLDLSYRGSSIAFEDGTVHGALRAGDRAPDAVLNDGTRLFDAFRGVHFTLLCFGACEAPALAGVRTVSIPGTVEAYGVRDGFALIRPDGYVSALSTSSDTIRDWHSRHVAARDVGSPLG